MSMPPPRQRLQPLRELRRFIRRQKQILRGKQPEGPVRYTPMRPEQLRARYLFSEASSRPDNFVLYRIVGNDLAPRHAKGQSRANVAFILENEPPLRDCEKRWVLNRISDPDEEARIVKLLEAHGQPYLRIPFEAEAYRRILWDASGARFTDLPFSKELKARDKDEQHRFAAHVRRLRNLYAMNNNGARNAAIADGRARAKWVLPFDGNCFFTAAAFDELRDAVRADPIRPYLIVPMARVTDNAALLDPDLAPLADQEPQVGFRCDATERFDERLPYGRRPKVELLWRLGVPGDWDYFRFDDWDFPRPPLAAERGGFTLAGWVARLESGRSDLEAGSRSFVNRGLERNRAVIAGLDRLDTTVVAGLMSPDALAYYDQAAIRQLPSSHPELAAGLRAEADSLLGEGPWSVTDKTTLPPSQSRNDYWHPAPYWWPDPNKPDGLPYLVRDGQRVPGTVLFGEGSEQYDRTSLQRMMDAATTLAIASAALDVAAYGRHAARVVDTWFINPATAMTPHLDYAQVRMGHRENKNAGSGIIELRNIVFLLDAVRLLAQRGHLSEAQLDALRDWLRQYAGWLGTSKAGASERGSVNNHSTFYDIQQLGIGLFLADASMVAEVRNRWPLRLRTQLQPDGTQPHELRRPLPRHYCAFNLQGWSMLARMLQPTDCDIWAWRDGEGRSLRKAVEVLAATEAAGWASAEAFDTARLAPLWEDYRRNVPGGSLPVMQEAARPGPQIHPDTAIPPYWMLAR